MIALFNTGIEHIRNGLFGQSTDASERGHEDAPRKRIKLPDLHHNSSSGVIATYFDSFPTLNCGDRSAVLGDGNCSLWAFILSYVAQFGHWSNLVVVDSPLLREIGWSDVIVGNAIGDSLKEVATLLHMVMEAMLARMEETDQHDMSVYTSFAVQQAKEAMARIIDDAQWGDIEGVLHLRILSILLGVDLHILSMDHKRVYDYPSGNRPSDKAVYLTLATTRQPDGTIAPGHYEANVPVATPIAATVADQLIVQDMIKRFDDAGLRYCADQLQKTSV